MDDLLAGSYNTAVEETTEEHEDPELLGMQISVDPDGSHAVLTLHTLFGAFRVTVPFGQMSIMDAEIRLAGLLMLYRQTSLPQPLTNPIDDLIRTAVRPSSVLVTIDKQSGDRIFIQQFGDRMPRVVRMSPEAVNSALTDLAAVAGAHAN